MSFQDSKAQPHSAEPASRPVLRRELRFAETAAVSVGVMAPTLAMSVTGVAAAAELGRAAPLAFVFAGLAVGLVAFGFVRLAAEFSHAGSVYAFVGRALSPRWGFVAGWAPRRWPWPPPPGSSRSPASSRPARSARRRWRHAARSRGRSGRRSGSARCSTWPAW